MMTWNSFFFNSPSSFLSEIVICLNDYVCLFLISMLNLIIIVMLFSKISSSFNFNFYENHQMEIIWTILPFILLLFIIIPSLETLYTLDTCLFCGMTIFITGHQWYWSYYYKDLILNSFDSYMYPISETNFRLLEVDNRLVIPSFVPVRFLASSADVIHSWTIPSLGVKMDAIPGRINQFCFSTKRSGVYFGQCSEICGANHSFMPICMESVPIKFLTSI